MSDTFPRRTPLNSKRLAIIWLLFGVITSSGIAHADTRTVAEALKSRLATHDKARAVQQQIDALRGTRLSRAQQLGDQTLAAELARTRAALSAAMARGEALTQTVDQQRQTRAGLIPLLEQMLELLARSVRADLPFAQPQRLAAIDDARRALTDATLGATDRLDKVLDVYNDELRLNYTTDIDTVVLDLAAGPRAFQRLRVGRVALYALSEDFGTCAVFELAQRKWRWLGADKCQQLGVLRDRLEQIPLDGLPLSVSTDPVEIVP